MDRTINDKIDDWDISLQRNVHMYCHALSVKKGKYKHSIQCEDLPMKDNTIGIWLYDSEVPEEMIKELQSVLIKLANKNGVKFMVYTSKDEFVTND